MRDEETSNKFKVHVFDKFLAQSKGIGLDSGEKDFDSISEFK